ncbi:hypothetical protein ACFVGY_01550 [Streptomyces sp. NPDC127106]
MTSMVPETIRCGAVVASTSHSGIATVSTLNWMAMMPSSAVTRR